MIRPPVLAAALLPALLACAPCHYTGQFQAIVDDFVQQANARGHTPYVCGLDIQIQSGLDLAESAGECQVGANQVRLDADYWMNADDFQRQLLLDHELGHCTMGLDHDEVMHGNLPESIMYPSDGYWFGYEAYYQANYKTYLDQLFAMPNDYPHLVPRQ